jgi:hypothetical protein
MYAENKEIKVLKVLKKGRHNFTEGRRKCVSIECPVRQLSSSSALKTDYVSYCAVLCCRAVERFVMGNRTHHL